MNTQMMIKVIVSSFLVLILDVCFMIILETNKVFRNCVIIFVFCNIVINYFNIDIVKIIVNLF